MRRDWLKRLQLWWTRRWRPLPLGRRGEDFAAKFLRTQGYRILKRNYKIAGGEIDIVAQDGAVLVFVEVKTRAYPSLGDAALAVDRHKQKQLSRIGNAFLRRFRSRPRKARFDIIAIVWPPGEKPQLKHYRNAFEDRF